MKHANEALPYDGVYMNWLNTMRKRVAQIQTGLYVTDWDGDSLWNLYLHHLPETEKQTHNCWCCQHFFHNYASLAYMDNGKLRSVFFDPSESDDVNKGSLEVLQRVFEQASTVLLQRFYSSQAFAGDYVKGGFDHIAAKLPMGVAVVANGEQVMARRREDIKNMRFALQSINKATAVKALTLLRSEALYRSEVAVATAEFLVNCYDKKGNDFVHYVGEAPEGFCHPRSSTISTLIENIEAGWSTENITKVWNDMMDPLKYKRPTAAPKAGNIERAEKLFAEMDLADSLKRRCASPDEVRYFWQAATEAKPEGLFGHLKPQEVKLPAGAPQAITLSKFLAKVLPSADKVMVHLNNNRNYGVSIGAVPDSKPILAWDYEEERNTVAMHTRSGGMSKNLFGLGQWSQAYTKGLMLRPHMKDLDYVGNRDKNAFWIIPTKQAPFYTGLFPENLRPEMREVSSVIEAYNRTAVQVGEPSEYIMAHSAIGSTVTVQAGSVLLAYHIDRWD